MLDGNSFTTAEARRDSLNAFMVQANRAYELLQSPLQPTLGHHRADIDNAWFTTMYGDFLLNKATIHGEMWIVQQDRLGRLAWKRSGAAIKTPGTPKRRRNPGTPTCRPDQIVNPSTNRCVLKRGKIGQELLSRNGHKKGPVQNGIALYRTIWSNNVVLKKFNPDNRTLTLIVSIEPQMKWNKPPGADDILLPQLVSLFTEEISRHMVDKHCRHFLRWVDIEAHHRSMALCRLSEYCSK